jgi:hypothetical protein
VQQKKFVESPHHGAGGSWGRIEGLLTKSELVAAW